MLELLKYEYINTNKMLFYAANQIKNILANIFKISYLVHSN